MPAEDGTTSVDELVAAIRGAEVNVVNEIISAVPDLNALSSDGESALVACAAVGRQQLLNKLLEAGASPDAKCSSGLSALAAAAMNGHLPCVRQLLSAGSSVDMLCGRQKSTALMYAAQNGYRAVCEALLDAGADPQLKDAFGSSAEELARRFEETGQMQAWNFQLWARHIEKRAQAIEAQPPPPRPPYPRDLAEDVKQYARDPSLSLWTPGEWVHQKRPPSASVLKQQSRTISSTGYGVVTPAIPTERSVLPGEEIAKQAARALGPSPCLRLPRMHLTHVHACVRCMRACVSCHGMPVACFVDL